MPNDCIRLIESDEDFLVWDIKEGHFKIDEERKAGNWAPSVRGLRLSLAADKAAYAQNEPIVLTAKLKNIFPASGYMCWVFPVNARMLIHTEIVFDVRNEKGEHVGFYPPAPPALLTAKDFKMLDGGQSVEGREEIASRFHEKPLAPGRYRIRATYQNYELGKTLGLFSCAGSSVLLEGGPAWTGRAFSNTITIEVKGQAANQASHEMQNGSIHQPDEAERKIEKVYYLNGSLFSETDLFSDRYNGFYRTYHKTGGIDTELRYKDGQIIYNQALDQQGRPSYRNGPVKTYYANGNLYEEIHYRNDMKNGLEKVYYYDGKTIVARGHYWNNRRVGVHQIYDPAGRLRDGVDWGYPTAYVQNLYKTIAFSVGASAILGLLISKRNVRKD